MDKRAEANKKRWAAMSAKKRSAHFRGLALKRARSMTSEELSEHGRKMRAGRGKINL